MKVSFHVLHPQVALLCPFFDPGSRDRCPTFLRVSPLVQCLIAFVRVQKDDLGDGHKLNGIPQIKLLSILQVPLEFLDAFSTL